MKKPFYITTTIPYVNAAPHVGFAMEIIHADVAARYHDLIGDEVFFNTGTDEHGAKVYKKATEEGRDPQEYTDEYSLKFRELQKVLGLWDKLYFIRTTDDYHIKAAQEFWKICDKNGAIYKKFYQIKYCVGCELEKTDSELIDGRCIIHPHLEIEIREEENYFFALSKYQDKLVEHFSKNPDFVIPQYRINEMTSLIEREGLEDFSISRLKNKMPWGVDVPGDPEHVMYVWFDAFINYISAIGWPHDMEKFNKWWPVVQVAGKDQVRQQAVMWQAMLLAAGLTHSKQIFIHGFINSGGQKMSKSLGNVLDPYTIVNEYGTDALRYYLIRESSFFEDSDFTMEKFKEAYNANLANGIGNLTSRIMKMAESNLEAPVVVPEKTIPQNWIDELGRFNAKNALDIVFEEIKSMDQHIQETTPFKLIKTDKEKGIKIIQQLVVRLYTVARMLNPLLPETSAKIKKAVKENKMPSEPLFLRKE